MYTASIRPMATVVDLYRLAFACSHVKDVWHSDVTNSRSSKQTITNFIEPRHRYIDQTYSEQIRQEPVVKVYGQKQKTI